MAYTKPGVLINQVQETISPALIEPDLYAGVVGRPYYVFKPGNIEYNTYWRPDLGEQSIDISSLLATQYPQISGVIDENSIYVDLVGISGVAAGQRLHASYDNSTGGTLSPNFDCYYSNGSLTVSGTTTNFNEHYDGSAFRVEFGLRVLRHDLQKAVIFRGGSDIQEAIGPVTVFNELGTALTLAASNSNRMTFAYGSTNTQDTQSTREAAQGALSSKEVYAFAPMTSDWTTAISDWKTFVDTQSLPENKKESVLVASPRIPWRDNSYGSVDSTEKYNTALDVSSRAAQTKARRTIMVHPDVAYVREKLHISQFKQSYLANNIGDDSFYTDYGLYALLTGSVVLSDGRKYFTDDEITDSVWEKLESDGIQELTVLVPIPGYMVSAAIVGQISGQDPEQPLTNLPIVGIERVKYSSDWFGNDSLNRMAEGGTYIVMQDQPTLPIYCRHQLTTDTTTVETRELNIVKSIDFASKSLRRNVRGMVGRNNITPQFLKILKTIVKGIGVQLVRSGVLADFKLREIKQDSTQRDKVKLKISVLASYPSNYIEIDLIY